MHYAKNMIIKLWIILLKSIAYNNRKSFVKTINLTYFFWLKKYSKIWNPRMYVIETVLMKNIRYAISISCFLREHIA